MGRKNRHPLIKDLEIIGYAAEGKSIAKADEKVVFVKGGVPGDVVDVQIRKKRRKYMEGVITHMHKLSSLRIEPVCSHFGVCGGCKWQNIPYSEQLKFKQQQVMDQLSRIGHLDLPEVTPILSSATTENYRNKLEFTFSNKRWLTKEEIETEEELVYRDAVGFHIPGLFDKVLDIEKCYLQAPPSNAIRNEIKAYALKHQLSFYDLREHTGMLRNLIIRTSTTGDLMVILSLGQEMKDEREGLLNYLDAKFPEITSLMYAINEKRNDTLYDQDIVLYKGKDHMIEVMEDLQFKVGPKSFFQTNGHQALELYKITRKLAGLTGKEVVYDLYTGTGTIANFVASSCEKVVGIESVPEAIEDAKVNSELNSITNTSFYAGDMKDVLTNEFIAQNGRPDVIITDPPRAGMHPDVIDSILFASPKKVVYVSCNPSTQARDLSLMEDFYKVEVVQPVDMFPHTHHVENVVLLTRKEEE